MINTTGYKVYKYLNNTYTLNQNKGWYIYDNTKCFQNDSVPPHATESGPPRGIHKKQSFWRLFKAKFIHKLLCHIKFTFIKAIIQVSLCEIYEYRIFSSTSEQICSPT